MSLYYEFVTSQATAVLKKMCQPLAVTTTTSSKLVTKQQQRFFASNASKRSQYDSKKIKEDFAYCVNLVKERDGEGYLCGLLLPDSLKQKYFALRAFNVEVASVKDGHNVRRKPGTQQSPSDFSSSFALQMRMNWWKNAIDEIYEIDEPIPDELKQDKDFLSIAQSCWTSPVVRALDYSYNSQKNSPEEIRWTKRFLERIVEARETDLEVSQYRTMEELSTYTEETVSNLLYLMLESAGVSSEDAYDVAYHAGIGIGLTTSLRSTPFRLQFGEVPLPGELFGPTFPFRNLIQNVYSSNDEKIALSESDAKILKDAVKHVSDVAVEHFTTVRQFQSKIPRKGKSCILLPAIPSIHYLSKLEEVQYNLFDPKVTDGQSQRLKLLFLLSRTWLTGIL